MIGDSIRVSSGGRGIDAFSSTLFLCSRISRLALLMDDSASLFSLAPEVPSVTADTTALLSEVAVILAILLGSPRAPATIVMV
jgi:hypothetical protein